VVFYGLVSLVSIWLSKRNKGACAWIRLVLLSNQIVYSDLLLDALSCSENRIHSDLGLCCRSLQDWFCLLNSVCIQQREHLCLNRISGCLAWGMKSTNKGNSIALDCFCWRSAINFVCHSIRHCLGCSLLLVRRPPLPFAHAPAVVALPRTVCPALQRHATGPLEEVAASNPTCLCPCKALRQGRRSALPQSRFQGRHPSTSTRSTLSPPQVCALLHPIPGEHFCSIMSRFPLVLDWCWNYRLNIFSIFVLGWWYVSR
jgi:hypothetical protein